MVAPQDDDRFIGHALIVERIEQFADLGINKRHRSKVGVPEAPGLGFRDAARHGRGHVDHVRVV